MKIKEEADLQAIIAKSNSDNNTKKNNNIPLNYQFAFIANNMFF